MTSWGSSLPRLCAIARPILLSGLTRAWEAKKSAWQGWPKGHSQANSLPAISFRDALNSFWERNRSTYFVKHSAGVPLSGHERRCQLRAKASATAFCLANVDCATCKVLGGDVLPPARYSGGIFFGEPLPWPGSWRFQAKPDRCRRHDPAAHDLRGHMVHPTRLPASCAIGARGTRDLALPLRTAHQLRATAIANARSAVYSASPEEG